MTDPVTLPSADARFQQSGATTWVAAMWWPPLLEADATVVVEALKTTIDSLAAGAADDAGMELNFRTPAGPNGASEGGIEVTVKCEGKSSVVTHPLPAAKT